MDSNTTSTDLITIQYDIISFCTDFSKISTLDQWDILFHQHRKWMMHCCIAVFFFTPLKKRELCYPYEAIFVFVKKIHLFCKFYTKSTKNIIYDFVLVCCKEKQISRFTFHRPNQSIHLFLCHEFSKGRFACTIFCNSDVSKTFCTISLGEINKLVNLLTRHASLAFCIDTTDTSTSLQCILEYYESAIFHYFTYIMQFHTKTHIRFVRTETVHSFLPCNSLNWKLDIHIQNFFKQISKESLIYIDNIVYVYKGKLHIDLCKFRLTICTKVLNVRSECNGHIRSTSEAVCTAAETVEGRRKNLGEFWTEQDNLSHLPVYSYQALVSQLPGILHL